MEGERTLIFHEPRCKVCRSPNRVEYEKMAVRGFSYRQIAREAKRLGEDISYLAMLRHLKRHFQANIDLRVESDKLVKEVIQRKVEEGITELDQLKKNLKILNDVVESALETELDARMLQALRALLAEIRLTLESEAKFRATLTLGRPSEIPITKFLEILEKLDLPPEKLEQARALLRTGVG
jgi:DNA-binding transcriptional ArsR family regulator